MLQRTEKGDFWMFLEKSALPNTTGAITVHPTSTLCRVIGEAAATLWAI